MGAQLLADLALVQPDQPELLAHHPFILSHEPQLLAHLTILQPHQPSVLAHEPAVQPGQPELLAHVALVQPHPRMTGKQQQIGSARVLTTASGCCWTRSLAAQQGENLSARVFVGRMTQMYTAPGSHPFPRAFRTAWGSVGTRQACVSS